MPEKDLTIVLPTKLTVPAIKGGAVENLLENFINLNEIEKRFKIKLICRYFDGMDDVINNYKYTEFLFFNVSDLVMSICCSISYRLCFFENPYYKKLIKLILEAGNNTVLVEGPRNFALALKDLLPTYNIYLHTHSSLYSFKLKKEMDLYKNIDKIITVSDFCKYEHDTVSYDHSKIFTVKNGIKTNDFDPDKINESDEEIRKYYKIPLNKRIILFKGRLVREKGLLELIKAFKLIDNDDTILLIAGGKNFADSKSKNSEYENEIINEINNDHRIIILGYIPYKDIPKINKISYISVVPSIYNDPAPLVVMESISSCRPLVVSNMGGIPEYANMCSEIVDVDDDYVINLSKSISKFLNDENYYNKIKENTISLKVCYNEEQYYNDLSNVILS